MSQAFSRMTNTTPPRSPHNASINGLRGFCVALVFMFHVVNSGLVPAASRDSWWQPELFYFFTTFRYGVEIFFMISGYVIVLSLRRHATIGAFFRDRALRIFPVWIPVLMSICIAGPVLGYPIFRGINVLDWLGIVAANALLLPPLLPFPEAHTASWSLSYEWLFYIVAALGLVLARPTLPQPYARWMWLLAVVAVLSCFPRAFFFLPGVLIALSPVAAQRASRLPGLSLLSLLVFLLAWRSVNIWDVTFNADTALWALFTQIDGLALVVSLIAATHFFACVVAESGGPLRLLRSRVLQQLGTISYSFYLWHPLVMFAVKKLLLIALPGAERGWTITLCFMLLSALVSWVLSYLSWRLFEVALARWLKGRAPSQPPALTPTPPAAPSHPMT